MNFSETIELLLARIYEFDKKNPGTQVNVGKIAESLGITNAMIIRDAVLTLERQGLVKSYLGVGSQAICFMTGEGRLFVEQGGNTNIIKKYQENPQQYIHVSNSSNVQIIAAGNATNLQQTQNNSSSQELINKLNLIKKALEEDLGLDKLGKNDAICDVDTLKSQLSRQKPDKSIINPILSRLANIATIATAIQQLTPVVWKLFQ